MKLDDDDKDQNTTDRHIYNDYMQCVKNRGVTKKLWINVTAKHCINDAADHIQKEESLFCHIKV